MKRLSLLLTVMMLVMLLCPVAYGSDWPQFQKDALNSGIYNSGGALPTSSTITTACADTQGGGWMGVDSSPIFADDYAYVYPIASIFEVTSDCSSSTSATVDTTAGFQLSSPAYSDNAIYVGVSDMINQTTNKDFTTNLTGWATGSSISPAPAFSQATVDGKTCVQMYEDSASTTGAAWISQAVTKPSASSLRVHLSYRQTYTGTAPTSSTISIYATPSGGAETLLYSTSVSTYDQWADINENVTFASSGDCEVRYEWSYATAAGSTATCCFTDCEFIAQSMGVKKVTGLGGSLSVDDDFCSLKESGQANTPLKVFDYGGDEYVVLGRWVDEPGDNSSGSYYCVNTSDGSIKWTFTPTIAAGFYWAGAACPGDVVIFGDDLGYVHVVNVSDGAEACVYDVDPNSTAHIRTSICYYDDPGGATDYLYLADYSGNLYQLTYDSTNKAITGKEVTKAGGVGYSTSTPVRIDNYVFYGTEDGLSVATITGSNKFGTCSIIGTIGGKVQASPVVYKSGSFYYIYVTKNTADGTAYCIRYNGSTATQRWSFNTGYYSLQGFAAANGRLYFGNDGGDFYVVY